MLPLIEREILIAELLETTAIECDVFHCCILAAVEIRHAKAAALDVIEGHITETSKECILSIFSDIYIDRTAVYLLHLNIREGKIFHQGSLAPEIIGVGVDLLVRKEAGDGVGCVMHHDVGESAITDDTVVGPAQTDSGRPASEYAVGHGHIFAYFVFFQRAVICTQNQSIISALYGTVGDRHMAGGIDMDAVIVRITHIRKDLTPVKPHIVTVMHPVAPSGRLVDHGYVYDPDIGTAGKETCARHRLLIRDYTVILPPCPVRILLRRDKDISVAVYLAPSGNRDIVRFIGVYQRDVPPTGYALTVEMTGLCPIRIVFKIRRTKKYGIGINKEFDTALELNCSCQKCTSAQDDTASSGLGNLIDCLLQESRDLCLAVCLRAELLQVYILG